MSIWDQTRRLRSVPTATCNAYDQLVPYATTVNTHTHKHTWADSRAWHQQGRFIRLSLLLSPLVFHRFILLLACNCQVCQQPPELLRNNATKGPGSSFIAEPFWKYLKFGILHSKLKLIRWINSQGHYGKWMKERKTNARNQFKLILFNEFHHVEMNLCIASSFVVAIRLAPFRPHSNVNVAPNRVSL